MDNELPVPIGPTQSFEQIKKVDADGEFWEARQLMTVLGYSRWENFERVIEKAKTAAASSAQEIAHHFRDITKMVPTGSGASLSITDYRLSRYACYLIAQNGDPTKQEIALAQTYFAIQARRQELTEQLPADEKRLLIRDEITTQNKSLFKTARASGVRNFGKFNDEGYRGLYGGLASKQIRDKKRIGKDHILDRAGASELAANLFRITQADEVLRKNPSTGEDGASRTHRRVGQEVREAIKKIGGRMPEDLPAQDHIKEVKKRLRATKKPQRIEGAGKEEVRLSDEGQSAA